MELAERIQIFERLFDELTSTNSRLDKEAIMADFRSTYPELQDDLVMILETLDGKHPLYYTFVQGDFYQIPGVDITEKTITEVIEALKIPITSGNCIDNICRKFAPISDFIEPIVNRTLRLGIGRSLLDKTKLTPMLAKKYNNETPITNPVYVTEKLDGNRCLAHFDENEQQWKFTSRSGRPLKVEFNMSCFPKTIIFDGEILSEEQTMLSIERTADLFNKAKTANRANHNYLFSQLSGIVNCKTIKKGLVYNIFDIIYERTLYKSRRAFLDEMSIKLESEEIQDVRIVPTLCTTGDRFIIDGLLDEITDRGGEGIMLNKWSDYYEHKRSNSLLKYKKIQTIDMRVTSVFPGKGKYIGWVGGLCCSAITEDGRMIRCEVGSGLTDDQRADWSWQPELIVGKIIEVAYHEMCQDRHNLGTKSYSLRFPRLKQIRKDKITTSEY